MAAARPRKTASSKQSRKTRAAYDQGREVLRLAEEDPAWAALRDGASPLLEELQQSLELLGMAPQLRIGAARRLQGVASRRRTAAQSLFEICVEVRRRVKQHFRGPKHAELRRAFGEGLPASPAKPGTALQLAAQILAAADAHAAELRLVHVRAQTLQRLQRLERSLRAAIPERGELRSAQQQISHNLVQLAERVEELCQRLSQLAGQSLPAPTADLTGSDPDLG